MSDIRGCLWVIYTVYTQPFNLIPIDFNNITPVGFSEEAALECDIFNKKHFLCICGEKEKKQSQFQKEISEESDVFRSCFIRTSTLFSEFSPKVFTITGDKCQRLFLFSGQTWKRHSAGRFRAGKQSWHWKTDIFVTLNGRNPGTWGSVMRWWKLSNASGLL